MAMCSLCVMILRITVFQLAFIVFILKDPSLNIGKATPMKLWNVSNLVDHENLTEYETNAVDKVTFVSTLSVFFLNILVPFELNSLPKVRSNSCSRCGIVDRRSTGHNVEKGGG